MSTVTAQPEYTQKWQISAAVTAGAAVPAHSPQCQQSPLPWGCGSPCPCPPSGCWSSPRSGWRARLSWSAGLGWSSSAAKNPFSFYNERFFHHYFSYPDPSESGTQLLHPARWALTCSLRLWISCSRALLLYSSSFSWQSLSPSLSRRDSSCSSRERHLAVLSLSPCWKARGNEHMEFLRGGTAPHTQQAAGTQSAQKSANCPRFGCLEWHWKCFSSHLLLTIVLPQRSQHCFIFFYLRILKSQILLQQDVVCFQLLQDRSQKYTVKSPNFSVNSPHKV